MVNRPYAIDSYDGDDVDGNQDQGFIKVKAYGVAFLDEKASEGQTYKSRLLGLRYDKWMDGEPIPVTDVDGVILQLRPHFGFYHFGDGGNSAAEATNYLSVIKPYFTKGDDCVYDWEPTPSGHYPSISQVDDWCNRVEDWCQFSIRVYGGNVPRELFQAKGIPSTTIDNFAKRRLWFCSYGSVMAELPLPWHGTDPDMWQDDGDKYGPGPHRIPGINNYCDNSTVTGKMTVAKLSARWGGGQLAA